MSAPGGQEPAQALTEGWGYPARERKIHFFRNGISLCRRAQHAGRVFEKGLPGPHTCPACTKARDREVAAELKLEAMGRSAARRPSS